MRVGIVNGIVVAEKTGKAIGILVLNAGGTGENEGAEDAVATGAGGGWVVTGGVSVKNGCWVEEDTVVVIAWLVKVVDGDLEVEVEVLVTAVVACKVVVDVTAGNTEAVGIVDTLMAVDAVDAVDVVDVVDVVDTVGAVGVVGVVDVLWVVDVVEVEDIEFEVEAGILLRLELVAGAIGSEVVLAAREVLVMISVVDMGPFVVSMDEVDDCATGVDEEDKGDIGLVEVDIITEDVADQLGPSRPGLPPGPVPARYDSPYGLPTPPLHPLPFPSRWGPPSGLPSPPLQPSLVPLTAPSGIIPSGPPSMIPAPDGGGPPLLEPSVPLIAPAPYGPAPPPR
jgi:hypothetical protein